ncbi:MAG TPA: ABC transporter permease [Acidimicrobiales bacterium]|nr:ABC transporter permease [Acidimicrobiales bacterium]
MIPYLLRRVAALAVTVLLALTMMFFLLHASPGSPVDSMGAQVAADPAAREAITESQGLDRPLLEQYGSYLGGLVRGDLGTSIYDGSSVRTTIATAAPVSAELGLLAIAVTVIPGLAAGIVAARRHGRAADGVVRVITLVAVSLPSYWLAVLCLIWIGERYPDLLPNAGGFVSFSEDPIANLQVMVLPAIVVGLSGFAIVARSVRSALVEAHGTDEVRFGRAAGLSERDVTRKLALRRAAPPSLAVAGLVVGGLLTGTVLVENVFQIPGLGSLMVTAFTRDDYPLALGCALVTAVVLLSVNLAVDVVLHLLDPRTRPAGRWR